MSQLGDTKKSFRFAIDLNGVQQMSVQKVSGLEAEIEPVAHGEGDSDVFTPGRTKFGKVTLERVQTVFGTDNSMWLWLQSARVIGSRAKKTFTVRQLSADGITSVAIWQILDAFPTKVSQGENVRTSSDNVMETVELSVDKIVRLL